MKRYSQQQSGIKHTGTFYNTIPEKGKELKASQKAVTGQERAILAVFLADRHKEYTPSEMAQELEDDNDNPKWPLTSIRRAITNLTSAQLLVKTDRYRPGIYGKREHIWKVI